MTRAVQINLKQRINSALNNEQMVISPKWIKFYIKTILSATVNQVSNYVGENVCQGFTSGCIGSLNAQRVK